MDNRENFEEMADVDAFIEYLRTLKRPSVYMLNPERAEQMKEAFATVKQIIEDSGCDAKVSCRYSEHAPNLGSVEVEGKSIEILRKDLFVQASSLANSTEVYPLANGDVRLAFGFSDLCAPLD